MGRHLLVLMILWGVIVRVPHGGAVGRAYFLMGIEGVKSGNG